MQLRRALLLPTTLLLCTVANAALAGAREDCETAINALGYPLTGYVFEERGIFSMEKHHIGGVTCYINTSDEIDSLYIGKEPIAEDGFFGREALKERERLEQEAEAKIEAADEVMARKVTEARDEYNRIAAEARSQRDQALDALRNATNPFLGETSRHRQEASQKREGGLKHQDAPAPNSEVPATSEDEDRSAPEQSDTRPREERERRYVNVNRLMRRSCPSSDCGSVGALMFREGVYVFEEKGGWIRISDYVSAGCVDGKSMWIEVGDAGCTEKNGIVDGEYALWVSGKYLSNDAPLDPAEMADAHEKLVKNSDDFRYHRDAFAAAAEALISSGRCTEKDFHDMGDGWSKATGDKANKPVYFMYCGGMHRDNRLYLNAETGKIFR